ncbi:MAG: OB-fold nucleic acid binding domain-containing protein [Pseudomonadota bacterium]
MIWSMRPSVCASVADRRFAVVIRLRQIKGFSEVDAISLVGARGNGYRAIEDIVRRAGLSPAVLEVLAEADAFNSLGLGRRAALWDVKGMRGDTLPLFAAMGESDRGVEPDVAWPLMAVGEEVVEDYARLRLTLRTHPIALVRPRLPARVVQSEALMVRQPDTPVTVTGLVICRQRPGSANGVIFVTLEDETGVANIIVWPSVFETYRRTLMTATVMVVHGRLQREGLVVHVVAEKLIDRSDLLQTLGECRYDPATPESGQISPLMEQTLMAHDGAPDAGGKPARVHNVRGTREKTIRASFTQSQARADEVNRPTPDMRDEPTHDRQFAEKLTDNTVQYTEQRRLPTKRNPNFPSRDFH